MYISYQHSKGIYFLLTHCRAQPFYRRGPVFPYLVLIAVLVGQTEYMISEEFADINNRLEKSFSFEVLKIPDNEGGWKFFFSVFEMLSPIYMEILNLETLKCW